MGLLHWTAAEFYGSTLNEAYDALERFSLFHAPNRDDDAPTQEEMDELARRYPDGPKRG